MRRRPRQLATIAAVAVAGQLAVSVVQPGGQAITTGGAVAPANTVAPAVTGTVATGGTLSCSTGTWTGAPAPAYAYQWKRDGADIGGATASTYALVAADIGPSITCAVTATNAGGSASATSNATSFDLAAVSGLKVFLDARQQTGFANGDPVGTATDFSGQGNAGTAAGGVRPTFRPTGWTGSRAAFEFAGGQGLTTPTIAVSTFGAFMVVKATVADKMLYEHSDNAVAFGGSWVINQNGEPALYVKHAGGASGRDVDGGFPLNADHVIGQTCDGTHAGHLFYVNSTTASPTSTSGGLSGDPGATPTSALTVSVGRRNTGSLQMSGLVRAYMLVTPAPSAAVAADIMRALGYHAGVTVT